MERSAEIAERVHLGHGTAREPAGDIGIPSSAFYINRDCDEDRRAAIEAELREAGLQAERISAVNGLDVPAPLVDYFLKDGEPVSRLRAGEIGCYASHLNVARIIVDRNLPYALVIEDDAQLQEGFADQLRSIFYAVPEGWDLVHLSGDCTRAVKPLVDLDGSHRLVRYSRIPSGTVAYLISLAGAKKLLVPMKRYWPIDTDIRQPWKFGLEVYGIVPSITRHDDTFASAIVSKGRSRLRRGLPKPSRGAWTGNPLHTPVGFYYNLKTLGPIWWLRCYVQNSLRRLSRSLGL